MDRIGPSELSYAIHVLEGQFSNSGYQGMAERLERAFSSLMDRKYSVSFCNGTATMHSALEVCGVGPGDEVIVPALTMSATTLSVLHAGATPVFADVDFDTLQISPEGVAAARTANTKAVIPVALYGGSPDYNTLLPACEGLDIIEDNAEAVGSTYDGRPLGSFGRFASYSLQSSKHLTSGEGGLVTTDDEHDADALRRFQSLGYANVSSRSAKISRDVLQSPTFQRHASIGWNYRLGEVLAAVALAQVERAESLVEARLRAGALYSSAASGFDWIRPQVNPPNSIHSYWTWIAVLDEDAGSWHDFRQAFIAAGGDPIYATWLPAYLEPMFTERRLGPRIEQLRPERLQQYGPGLCPTAERLQPRVLQFTTNHYDRRESERQASILHDTLTKWEKQL